MQARSKLELFNVLSNNINAVVPIADKPCGVTKIKSRAPLNYFWQQWPLSV